MSGRCIEEFYALARTRLRPGGYISQWLPAYQVPAETTLAMVRAFVDVFPEAVLLSGAESDLLLLGTTAARIEIDPEQVAARLAGAPEVRADLERIDLDDVHEIVGTFVGSPATLAAGTRDAAPVTDDRPLQEYGVRSMLNFGRGVPSDIVNLGEVAAWCPRCFMNGAPVPAVAELDTYLALLDIAYGASRADVARVREVAERQGRVLAGSRYLGMIVPESAAVHNLLGIAHASAGRLDTAVEEFREAVRLAPDDASAHWHLGAALASQGAQEQAAVHLRRSVELDPGNGRAQNDLGVLLAGQGRLEEAIGYFRRALALDPGSADARRNLDRALRCARKTASVSGLGLRIRTPGLPGGPEGPPLHSRDQSRRGGPEVRPTGPGAWSPKPLPFAVDWNFKFKLPSRSRCFISRVRREGWFTHVAGIVCSRRQEGSMKSGVVRWLITIAAVLALPVMSFAQEAVVTGTVRDATGGVLPGVTVTAVHEDSGNTFLSVSDERGSSGFPRAWAATESRPNFRASPA